MQIKGGMENENLPQTSKAFNKYGNMQVKMQQMGEDLLSGASHIQQHT